MDCKVKTYVNCKAKTYVNYKAETYVDHRNQPVLRNKCSLQMTGIHKGVRMHNDGRGRNSLHK